MKKEINKNKIRDLFVKINNLEYRSIYYVNAIDIIIVFIAGLGVLSIFFFGLISIFIAIILITILSKINKSIENSKINDYNEIKQKYKNYFRLNNEFEESYNKFLFYVNKDLTDKKIDAKTICEIYENINLTMKLLQKQVSKLIKIKNLEEKDVFLKKNEYNEIKKEFLHEAQFELKYFIADFYEKLKIWLDTHKKKLQELNKKLLNEKETYDEYAKKAVFEISSFAILEQVNYLEKIKI